MIRPCVCDRASCRLCWLYFNNADYHALWNEQGPSADLPRSPRRPLPCVHLGRLVERGHCLCPRLDKRQCDKLDLVVSQAGECEECPAYEAEG